MLASIRASFCMDVTFRERESYYRTTNNIGITLSPPEVQQEGGD
jgi:hypothetical protein